MNLANLKLENFGKFDSFECNLTPGLNVIKGANETGKSTIVSAITVLFYNDPKAADKDFSMFKTWGSNKPSVLKADISDENFYGILEKNFDSGQAKLDNKKHNIEVTDNNKISEILTGSIGLKSAELFEATSCIKQGEITQIGGSVEQIKMNLESLVTGGVEDKAASQLVEKIDKRINTITNNDAQNPGLVKKLESEQGDIDYNIDRINREINNLKTWRNSLSQVEIAYDNVSEDYKSKKLKLESASKNETAQNEQIQIVKQRDEAAENLKKVKSATAKTKELRDELTRIVDVTINDRENLEELESTIKYLRPKQRDLESDVESDQREYDGYKISGALLGWMVLSLAAIGFAAADYFLFLTQFILYCFHIGGGGIASLMVSLTIFSRANQKKSFLKNQLKNKNQKLESTVKEIDRMSSEFKSLLEKYRIRSADEARQASWKRSDLEKQLDSETKRCKSLLEGISEEELELKVQNLDKKFSENEILLKDQVVLEPAELERLKLIVAQLEEQYNTLASEKKTLNRQIETAEGGTELLGSYLERKEIIINMKGNLVEELVVLSLTKECVYKARQNVMISTLELLEKRTSDILNMITKGKYNKVRFDKASLNFEVYSDKKKDWVNPNRELSQETVEQIYLTARLALTEIIANKISPPIILDDPFNGFDMERRENTMELLKDMSKKYQVLLLTANDTYDKWADNIIQL